MCLLREEVELCLRNTNGGLDLGLFLGPRGQLDLLLFDFNLEDLSLALEAVSDGLVLLLLNGQRLGQLLQFLDLLVEISLGRLKGVVVLSQGDGIL